MALAAILMVSFVAPACARAQLLQATPGTAEELLLPDAPTPQQSDPSAASSAAGQTTPSDSGQPAGAAGPSAAQPPSQPASSAAAPQSGTSDADAKKKQREEAEEELKAEEKQRLLGVMPQFQVVMNGQAAPLTGGQKWRLALHSAIDPFYIGWALVIGGGYAEIVGSHDGYDWGPAGYFKRVGANYADNVNGALIGNALLPQLLHQDPRYFRKGKGSFGSRFAYAALSTIICHGDNGKNQPNVSNVLGNYISGAISNAYYPANERGLALTLENGTSVTIFGALGGQLLEFGPDIARLLHRHKTPATPATAPAGAPSSGVSAAPANSPATH